MPRVLRLAGSLLGNNTPSDQIVYKGIVVVQKPSSLCVTDVGASMVANAANFLGMGITLQLISSTAIDSSTNTGKLSKPAALEKWLLSPVVLFGTDEVKYSVKFTVDPDFGLPGAFSINNGHLNEFFLVSLTVELPGGGKHVEFPCHSWVFNSRAYKTKRIFFSNEFYLPADTPKGLITARYNDLIALRGNGSGTRKACDRIYDYDVYNDLGNPLLNAAKRPVMGGSKEYPYPRRCRTGRTIFIGVETSGLNLLADYYIPSDERFSSVKATSFLADGLKSLTHGVLPILKTVTGFKQTFGSFKEVKDLYDQGLDLSKIVTAPINGIKTPFQLFNQLNADTGNTSFMKFPVPQVFKADEKGWMLDSEFAREMLSGLNPMVIEALTEFPPMSTLDSAKYGPQKSAITEKHIVNLLEGLTVQKALDKKKLFIVNYHDSYMPYLDKINSRQKIYAYASRTLLYLKSDGTLQPVAIELNTPYSQRVFVPPAAGQIDWLWELAKAHAAANDAGYHQLVSHWLRTHACVEPFIIATNRQLSKLHPLNTFLQPHFKNTMAINAKARKSLINAKGIIERTFSLRRYSVEMSSLAYKGWRFDQEGLPADLLKRGMAVPDATSKGGVKLIVEDYPYAVDGLEIWTAIEKWVTDYLEIYYKNDASVTSDPELQAWWSELINKGHADKKDEKWWIKLDSKKSLTSVLTTLIWIASAHHAAVNFGQYAYAGYMPNRPTTTHRPIPEKDSDEHKKLLADPERFFLSCVSSKMEAILCLLTVEILSSHAAEEEYLGQRAVENWTANANVKAAFVAFGEELRKVERSIINRNNDPALKNRVGAVNVPYTLLYPSSANGITGKGIPNSISI
ncbi:hypothetical protein SELMODRAFT_234610 [Selaginella moellendorffii]|uniref:Lipoxygenase n=1 Tax=Selaginella moellendorffii TaxID=88036 RepID=D8SN12_SELML|nr:linoleate 9S-lipoxygenase [Selaginella moellendorffii]EFJ14272.1 hypothetical protein SELMODRAFT_234610 [Selaginella moellendorffii]|eukprot:XP_002984627.1 linoleate 9S-lipoxygenase [Selaginella moellendorffii]